MSLTSHDVSLPTVIKDISNEDILKCMIDLLYTHTAISNSETLKRNKTIQQIKELLLPYIKN